MDATHLVLLLAAFTETYLEYQLMIYAPFYISEETHAIDSTINLFVALTLSSYPLGLMLGHKPRHSLLAHFGPKQAMKCHFAMNMLGVLIQSDCHVFDRSIYHFVAGNLVMGSLGNSWSSILSTAHHLQRDGSSTRNALYCSISTAHGMGAILAGLIGAFFDVHSQPNTLWIDTPFIVGIVLCAVTMIAVHFYIKIPVENGVILDDEDRVKCSESLLFEAGHRQSSLLPTKSTANGQNDRYRNEREEDREGVLRWHSPSAERNEIESESLSISWRSCFECGDDEGQRLRLWAMMWLLSMLLFVGVVSFDVVFASYCSISSVHGGMGWNGHFVGLFYVFYGFSWILLILHRFWKLKGGHSVTTSFSNSSVKMLRVNALSLTVIYGVIFPFCINSPTINHVEWTPISWLLLGFILAVLLGIISASTSYHIAQCLHDLTLNEVMADSSPSQSPRIQSENVQRRMDHKVQSLLETVSRSMLFLRVLVPMVIQFCLVLGIHLNNTMISKHLHSKRQWYQIGNFVFYLLAFGSLSALLLLIAFDNARRERFGEEVDRQEMNRLIHELRKGLHSKSGQLMHSNTNTMLSAIEQEDPHGLGFWISLNTKSMLSALPICPENKHRGVIKESCCSIKER